MARLVVVPLAVHRRALAKGALLSLRGGTSVESVALAGSVQATLIAYGSLLQAHPLLTKALTSGVIFAIADICAQRIRGSRDLQGTLVTALVGLLYYGPSTHYWYSELMPWLIPQSGVGGTLAKMILGQLLFAPAVTLVFFSAFLLSLQGPRGVARELPTKVRRDLMPTLMAGWAFWPLVDLVSFSLVPPLYIPLCLNVASFLWTIFLAVQAARGL